MDGSDMRGSGASEGAGWSEDPADQWVLDPASGEYRLRLPGEHPPAAGRQAHSPHYTDAAPRPGDHGQQDHGRDDYGRGGYGQDGYGRGEYDQGEYGQRAEEYRYDEHRYGAEGEDGDYRYGAAGYPEDAAHGRDGDGDAEGAEADGRGPRAGDRAAARRRGQSSAGSGRLIGPLTLVGLLGCAVGGFMLLHSAADRSASCTHTVAVAPPSPSQTGPTLGPGPSAAPINVRVTVYDGSGKFGEAETVLSWMQNTEGYTRSTNGGPISPKATTSLVYAPDKASQARTLAAAMHLPPSALHGTGTGSGYFDPMVLTLGRDFVAPAKPLASAAPSPSSSTGVCRD